MSEKIGKFELANGGTMYLDDVDDVPLELQVKLLRALEEREIERVGGSKVIKLDIRMIASTKKNLLQIDYHHLRFLLIKVLNQTGHK